MKPCANSRQPTDPERMDKFLNILKERIKYFDEEVSNAYNYCDELIEFCEIPFCLDQISTTKEERQELKQIIKKIKEIKYQLYKTRKSIELGTISQNLEDF